MRIIVFGLGHVGIVTVASLLRDGHVVVGVDTDDDVRNCVARGLSPFREPGIAALIASGHAEGRLSVRTGVGDAVDADLAIVCVGTQGLADGRLDLSEVDAVARRLGEAVRLRPAGAPPMLLVFRSTMLPGSMTETVLPAIAAAAGEPPGTRYDVAYSPAFTREGSALADYFAPARNRRRRTPAGKRTRAARSAARHRSAGIHDLVRDGRTHETRRQRLPCAQGRLCQ